MNIQFPFRAQMTTFFLLILAFASLSACALSMPGKSFPEKPAPLSELQQGMAAQLRRNVEALFEGGAERNIFHIEGLRSAEMRIERELQSIGYQVEREEFVAQKVPVRNIRVEIKGDKKSDEVLVIGAHYDSVNGSPGANDNGSGVALLIELARALYGKPAERTIQLIFFVNEEPPFFWTDEMGSVQSAKRAKERGEKIVGMISLETLGYYSEEKDSQRYPSILSWFYPSRGNFVAFVGMSSASRFLKCSVGRFRKHARIPSEGAALPWLIPHVGSSDHWSYWKQGYPSLMITDTAMYRYRHYHTTEDTPAKLNYEMMVHVLEAIIPMVVDLAAVDSLSECK